MARTQREIVRTLDHGLAVAWDTTDVSPEVRKEFQDAVGREVDAIVKVLGDDGREHLAIVEVKTKRRSRAPKSRVKQRRASRGA
jgi:hypothetical protein